MHRAIEPFRACVGQLAPCCLPCYWVGGRSPVMLVLASTTACLLRVRACRKRLLAILPLLFATLADCSSPTVHLVFILDSLCSTSSGWLNARAPPSSALILACCLVYPPLSAPAP